MRILQVLPPRPSEYEKKSQRIDLDALRLEHEVVVGKGVSADITLIYGKPPVSELPEAVEESYFSGAPLPSAARAPRIIASFRRQSIMRVIEQTVPRLHR